MTVVAALIAVWLRRRRAVRDATTPKEAAQLGAGSYEFRSACSRGDLHAAARVLLRRAQRDRPALRNLGELAREVSDTKQSAVLAELERALYGGAASADPALARRLGDAFSSGPTFAGPVHLPARDVLPALYPFDLGQARAGDRADPARGIADAAMPQAIANLCGYCARRQ